MDIDVSIDGKSLVINIENPYRVDVKDIMNKIKKFAKEMGVDIEALRIEALIPKMIKGVAGCEAGCPADAKSVVREGFKGFDLSYIEGGILTANTTLKGGRPLQIKVFPEF
jgi:NH3-dependent NAD+ synthetase